MIGRARRLVWLAINRFFDHNGPDRAAAVAYYTLLSLLPLLIFVISVAVALLGSFEEAYKGTLFVFGGLVVHMDQRALEALRSFVEGAVRFQWPGILLLAWTSKRIFTSLFSALETVFEVPGRGFARGNLLGFAMVLVAGAGVLLTMTLTLVLASVEGLLARYAGALGLTAFQGAAAWLLTYVVPVLVTAAFFFMVYRLMPRRVVSTTHAAIGALLATLLWETAKAGFAYYVRNLARYGGVYGTLEAVIVLALWLELSVSIILFCGEVVALLIAPGRAEA